MPSTSVTGVAEVEGAFLQAAATALPVLRKVARESAQALEKQWRSNARSTAGKHGKRYPSAITATERVTFGAATYDIGPDSDKPQGGMGRGFEFGSIHQPPHLDGTKAAAVVGPAFLTAAETAAKGLL